MRWIMIAAFVTVAVLGNGLPTGKAAAQGGGWCGYALIEDLPLLENQLNALAAITPTRSQSAKPNELFQYRYSLDRTKVIIEGCWGVYPTPDIFASLLATTVQVDVNTVIDQRGVEAFDGILMRGATQFELNRAYVADRLTLSLFAPGGSREESAALCRAYLETNAKAWEPESP